MLQEINYHYSKSIHGLQANRLVYSAGTHKIETRVGPQDTWEVPHTK